MLQIVLSVWDFPFPQCNFHNGTVLLVGNNRVLCDHLPLSFHPLERNSWKEPVHNLASALCVMVPNWHSQSSDQLQVSGPRLDGPRLDGPRSDGPGFQSQWGQEIFIVTKSSRLAVGPTLLPIRWVSLFFPGGKAARVWCQPLTSIWCWVWEWLELYFYSLMVWRGATLSLITFYLPCYDSTYL